MKFGLGYWHWFFLAQPYPLPETLIGANPDFFFSGRPNRGDVHAPEALEDYLRCYRNPATIHAACEDYRAGATYDFALDEADRGKKKIAAPLLALWAGRGLVGSGTTCSRSGATGRTTCAATRSTADTSFRKKRPTRRTTRCTSSSPAEP